MNVLTGIVLTATLAFSKQTNFNNNPPEREEMELELQKMNISMNKSALRYIKDVYDFVKAKENEEGKDRNKRNSYLDLAGIERQLLESDTVATFDAIVTNKETEEGGSQLSFAVSKMSENQKVVESELRIFQNGVLSLSNDTFTVSVYEVQDSSQKLRISSVNTSGNFVGWLRLNITSWTTSFKTNKRLYLTVITTDQVEISPESIGLLNSDENDETKPFMVIFLRSKQFLTLQQLSVEKIYPSTKRFKGGCQRHRLYVDFKAIGWNDFIVAPPGYDAYYCSGNCDHLLMRKVNATNHAKVLDLVKHFNPQVPEPCCVPKDFSSITMMYLSDGNVILKSVPKMVVTSCECR